MILLTLVSSKKFLKREALPKELNDDIILQEGSEDRFHSPSIPITNVKHIIPKPIKQTKPMVNQGSNNKPKKYHNQNIPIPKPESPIPHGPHGMPLGVRPIKTPKQGLKDNTKK